MESCCPTQQQPPAQMAPSDPEAESTPSDALTLLTQTTVSDKQPATPDSLPAALPSGYLSSTSWDSRPCLDTRRSSAASDLLFSPRTQRQVTIEETYLTSALQKQLTRATNLSQRCSTIREELETMEQSKERRKHRKRLSSLCSKYKEAASQASILHSSLNELRGEDSGSESWCQSQFELGLQECSLLYNPGHFALSPTSLSLESSIIETPLDGAAPEFLPLQSFNRTITTVGATGVWSGPPTEHQSVDTIRASRSFNREWKYKYEYGDDDDDELDDHKPRHRCSFGTEKTVLRGRRLSLPNMHMIWP